MKRSDLRSVMSDVRASFVPFVGNGAGVYYPVRVGPRLGFAMTPRRSAERSASEGRRDRAARQRERIEFALSGGQGPPTGLGEGIDSESTEPENSFPGWADRLTDRGAKAVEEFCSLVRQDRGLYAMWTVTLPPMAVVALNASPQGFNRFVGHLRRAFSQVLARACARERGRQPCLPHWAYVVEKHKSGVPHLHFVFRCRSRMGRPWLLSTGRLDRVISQAIGSTIGLRLDCNRAGNVQALRKDPGSYLSKYLRKGRQDDPARHRLSGPWSPNLYPATWWGMSVSARIFLESFMIEIPGVFVGWLSSLWPQLQAAGLMKARIWRPPAEGAPQIVVGGWGDPQKFRDVMMFLAQCAEDAVGFPMKFGVT